MFCMLKDHCSFTNDLSLLHTNCASCNDSSHDENICSVTHFTPRYHKIIHTQLLKSEEILERKQFLRRKVKINSLFDLPEIQYFQEYMVETCTKEIDQFEENYFQFSNFRLKDELKDFSESNFNTEEEPPKQEGKEPLKTSTLSISKEFKSAEQKITITSYESESKLDELENLQTLMEVQPKSATHGKQSRKQQFISRLPSLNLPKTTEVLHAIEMKKTLPLLSQKFQDKLIRKQQKKESPLPISKRQQRILQVLIDKMSSKRSNYEYNLTKLNEQATSTPQIHVQQIREQSEDQLNRFECFLGQFEKACDYKNYYPFHNLKKVLMKIASQSQLLSQRQINIKFDSRKPGKGYPQNQTQIQQIPQARSNGSRSQTSKIALKHRTVLYPQQGKPTFFAKNQKRLIVTQTIQEDKINQQFDDSNNNIVSSPCHEQSQQGVPKPNVLATNRTVYFQNSNYEFNEDFSFDNSNVL